MYFKRLLSVIICYCILTTTCVYSLVTAHADTVIVEPIVSEKNIALRISDTPKSTVVEATTKPITDTTVATTTQTIQETESVENYENNEIDNGSSQNNEDNDCVDAVEYEYDYSDNNYESYNYNDTYIEANKVGYSIYGNCLDGKDMCVRLEQYMAVENGDKNGWAIERCYIDTDNLGGKILWDNHKI